MDPIGHVTHLMEKRDAVLAGARVSPAARARIMGRPAYPSAIYSTPPVKPAKPAEIPGAPRGKQLQPAPYGVRDVIRAVAKTWNVKERPLMGRSKSRCFTRPRFAVVLLMRERMLLTHRMIAQCFNRESDASGHDMVTRAMELRDFDPAWVELYRAAEHALDHK